MKMTKARLALYTILACLLLSSAIATAYAKYTSTYKTNQFTVYVTAGTITLNTTGDNSDLAIIPGTYVKLEKQPVVSVASTSEDCYVFLTVDMSEDIASIVTLSALSSSAWNSFVVNNKTVYYRESTKADNDPKTILNKETGMREYAVFADINKAIWVSPNATRQQISNIKAEKNNNTITFTAYAVQKTHGIETVEAAWNALTKTN